MPRQYITVDGDIRTYKFKRNKNTRTTPICKCGTRAYLIYKGSGYQSERIGYECPLCNFLYILKKYDKVFRGELK